MSEEAPGYADRVTVTVPRSISRRLKFDASASGKTVSSIVREALERYYAGQEPLPLPSFTGIARSGRSDGSRRVKQIVGEAILKKHGK